MVIRRPKVVQIRSSRRVLEITPANQLAVRNLLSRVSDLVRYVSSPYHRAKGSRFGQAGDRRWPHASKCPPKWNQFDADRALKNAVLEGNVSEEWKPFDADRDRKNTVLEGNVSEEWKQRFPRFIWYKDDEVLYEARLSNEQAGQYHGYPLEDEREWPRKFKS